jgi:hypothetical protein
MRSSVLAFQEGVGFITSMVTLLDGRRYATRRAAQMQVGIKKLSEQADEP